MRSRRPSATRKSPGLRGGPRHSLESTAVEKRVGPRRRVRHALHIGGALRKLHLHPEEGVRRRGERIARDEQIYSETESSQQRRVLVHRRDDPVKVDLVLEVGRFREFRLFVAEPLRPRLRILRRNVVSVTPRRRGGRVEELEPREIGGEVAFVERVVPERSELSRRISDRRESPRLGIALAVDELLIEAGHRIQQIAPSRVIEEGGSLGQLIRCRGRQLAVKAPHQRVHIHCRIREHGVLRKIPELEALNECLLREQGGPHGGVGQPEPVVDAGRSLEIMPIDGHRRGRAEVHSETRLRERRGPILEVGEFPKLRAEVRLESRGDHQRQPERLAVFAIAIGQRGPESGLLGHVRQPPSRMLRSSPSRSLGRG